MGISVATPASHHSTTGTISVTPSGTIEDVLGDIDDDTYITLEDGESVNQILFSDIAPAIPAGARVTSLKLLLRAGLVMTVPNVRILRTVGITSKGVETIETPLSSQAVQQIYPLVVPSSDAEWDELQVSLAFKPHGGPDIGGGANIKITTCLLLVNYIEKPVVNVTAPSGTLTDDNSPTIEWENTLDSNGGAQFAAGVKIYDGATYGNFSAVNPDIDEPYLATSFFGDETSWDFFDVLPDDDYRVYVRVTQYASSQSDWDYSDFTLAVETPAVPELILTPQEDQGRVRIQFEPGIGGDVGTSGYEVQRLVDGEWVDVRLPVSDQAEKRVNKVRIPSFENSDITDFYGTSGVTLTRDNAHAEDGTYALKVVANGSGGYQGFNAAANGEMTFDEAIDHWHLKASVYLASGSLALGFQVGETIGGDFASNQPLGTVTLAPGWNDIEFHVGVGNPGCDGGVLQVFGPSTPTAFTIWTDKLLVEGYREQDLVPVGYFDGDSSDARWLGTADLSASEMEINPAMLGKLYVGTTLWDYEAPNEEVTYRARAFHLFTNTLSFSDWVEGSCTLAGGWWLKHPTNPELNVSVELRSFPEQSRSSTQEPVRVLGKVNPVFQGDTVRAGESGEIVLASPTDLQRDAIKRIADYVGPVLLQAGAGHHEPDRWVVLGDEQVSRFVDKSWASERDISYSWAVVDSPSLDYQIESFPLDNPVEVAPPAGPYTEIDGEDTDEFGINWTAVDQDNAIEPIYQKLYVHNHTGDNVRILPWRGGGTEELTLLDHGIIEDLRAYDAAADPPLSGNGTTESNLWVGIPVEAKRLDLRRGAWMGLWTGGGSPENENASCTDALFEDMSITGQRIGIYCEHVTRFTQFRRFLIEAANSGVVIEWTYSGEGSYDLIFEDFDITITGDPDEDWSYKTDGYGFAVEAGTYGVIIRNGIIRNAWGGDTDGPGNGAILMTTTLADTSRPNIIENVVDENGDPVVVTYTAEAMG